MNDINTAAGSYTRNWRKPWLEGMTARLLAIAAACVSTGTAVQGRTAPSGSPNLVLIMADDLGYGHLGCYGQKRIRTPHLDRLASEGMRFTQVYSGCNVCAPSRSVLMTGLHSGHGPVRGNLGGIPMGDADVTVAEVLKQAGYATGGFGKWGLGDAETTGAPYRQGFDEFFGYYNQVHAHSYYPPYLWHNDRKYLLPANSGRESDGLTGEQRGQYSHDEIVAKALDFIRRNKDRPFFCYIPSTIPHTELLVPDDSLREYAGSGGAESVRHPGEALLGSAPAAGGVRRHGQPARSGSRPHHGPLGRARDRRPHGRLLHLGQRRPRRRRTRPGVLPGQRTVAGLQRLDV